VKQVRECDLIKTHSHTGIISLSISRVPWPVSQIVQQHHEGSNGTGNPRGLKQADVFIEARIITVAMSLNRWPLPSIRPALDIVDRALEEAMNLKGILYDFGVVDACVKLFEEKGLLFDQQRFISDTAR